MSELTLKDYKKIRTPFAFIDETGSVNDQANKFFGLGVIKCMQPYYLDSQIHYLRQKYKFYEEIKWNTLSKKKLPFIKDLLGITFSTPGIYFRAVIVDKTTVDFSTKFLNDPYIAYQKFTEHLLLKSITQTEVLCVLADYISTPDNVTFEVSLKHSLNEQLGRLAIAGVHRIDSKGSNMLQLVDLFLGATIYEAKLKTKAVSGDKNKIEVMKLIQNHLNTSELQTLRASKFRVTNYA